MTARRYKVGDGVTWKEDGETLSGQVVAFRDLADRQFLYVKISEDQVRQIIVALQTGVDGVSIILPPPATIEEATALAQAILRGEELHMPVNTQLRVMAHGLLELTDLTEGTRPSQ